MKLFDIETTEKGKRIASKSGAEISRVIGFNKGFQALLKKLEHERIRFVVDLTPNWNDSVTIDFDVIDNSPILKRIEYRDEKNNTVPNQNKIQNIVDALIRNWE